MNEAIKEKIVNLTLPIVEQLKIELIEVSVRWQGKFLTIEVLADRPEGGITIDECSALNRQLAQILEESQLISEEYNLEVSSPGIDRPLKTKKDFARVLKKDVRFHMKNIFEGKLEHIGRIEAALDSTIRVKTKLKTMDIPLDQIQKAVQIF